MDGMEKVAGKPAKLEKVSSPSRQVLAVRMGRGRTGGSTLADWLIQCARHAGRAVAIGDGDRRNPTLSGLYPPGTNGGATQPVSDETADVKDWITKALGDMTAHQGSLVLDLGGGDRVLAEYGRDLGLVEFCDMAGIKPLALFVSGPEMDDFEHVLTIWKAGYFKAAHSVLVFNEHLVSGGRTPMGAFDAIIARPEMDQMIEEGLEPIFMPRLPCMKEMRAAGLSFLDAVANKPGLDGKPLDPVRQFMVTTWHKKMVKAFDDAGASAWLP
jgi:hypothetical protein